MPFDYEAAEAALQHPGSPLIEDSSSQSSSTTTVSSDSQNSPHYCNDGVEEAGVGSSVVNSDRFTRRLLRRCRKDRELQSYVKGKIKTDSVGEACGDIEVINCDSPEVVDPDEKHPAKERGEAPKNGSSASKASPEFKRRKRSEEKSTIRTVSPKIPGTLTGKCQEAEKSTKMHT